MSVDSYYLVEGLQLVRPDDSTYLCYHPDTQRYFKISEQLYFVLNRLREGASVSDTFSQYKQYFDSSLTESQLNEKLASIEGRLIVRDPEEKSSLVKKDKPSYLKLSRMVVPPKLLNPITSALTFLFIPRVAIPLLLLFVTLLTTAVVTNYEAIKIYYDSTSSIIILWYILFMAISSIWHELGHATACRYFGAAHGGIGVGFYLLSPVMYADVTDAWRLPAKNRVVINLAGIYFEVVVSVLLLIYFFASQNIYALTLCLLTLVKIGINLNPFFRTDGYWVLSDLARVPNLRFKSNQALLEIFSRKKPKTIRNYALAAYSTVSYVFMGLFVYYVLFEFDGSLLYFPLEIKRLYLDYIQGRPITALEIGRYFQNILIPIMFYYLLGAFVIRRLVKRKKA